MKQPFIVMLQLLGLYSNDENDYFNDPENFTESQEKFPLNRQFGKYGIDFRRLDNFVRKKFINDKNINGKLNYSFYNYTQQQFISMYDLMVSMKNFIELDCSYWQEFNEQRPLILKMKVQLYYNEYRKINFFLDDLQQQKQKLKERISQNSQELKERTDILRQFDNEMVQLKSLYPIKSNLPQIDVALLYSHPLINSKDQKRSKDPVSYYQEIQNVMNQLLQENKMIKCLIAQANKDNLKYVLQYGPKIIHIMSHGDFDKSNSKYCLQFENDCYDQLVYTEQLQSIMSKMKNLKLVILSSCHSGEIAKMISQYAPTIAVQADLKMLDEASIHYSGALYSELLKQNSLQESHNLAKLETERKLKQKIYTCCCSHAHKDNCKFQGCIQHFDCQCVNKLQLWHIWQPQQKCKIKNNILNLWQPKVQEDIEKMLDSFAVNGELRTCCCELSIKIDNSTDQIIKIEHNESEKFQIFSTTQTANHKLLSEVQNDNHKLLSEVQNGQLIQLNKFDLNKQLNFIGWQQDVVQLYNKLGECSSNINKKIIILFALGIDIVQTAVKYFAQQAAEYFIDRELKFYENKKLQKIDIITNKLNEIPDNYEDINETPDNQFCQIKIIYETTLKQFQQKVNTLQELSKKRAVIVIANQEIFQQCDENSYYKIHLTDWNRMEDSQKLVEFYFDNQTTVTGFLGYLQNKYNRNSLTELSFQQLLIFIQEYQNNIVK